MSAMVRRAAVPFHLKRNQDHFAGGALTSTKETIHGLLRLEGDRLTIQWRRFRRTEQLGSLLMRSDTEMEPLRELVIPVAGLAGAAVRRRRWLLRNPELVLRAADLRAFGETAGEGGLPVEHPAELVLGLRRSDLLLAEEFAAELALAVAERTLPAGETAPALPPSPPLP